MFFVLSKVFWFFADPANVLFFLLLTGTILLWTRWKRTARFVLTGASVFALVVISIPIGTQLGLVLENRFPVPKALPEKVDGVVVLGGAVDQYITNARGEVALGGSAERIVRFSSLAREYPDAKLVYSGGSGYLTRQEIKEADVVASLLQDLGVNPEKVTFENQSRNTFENATMSYATASPGPDEVWILVTSAFHMPRAIGCFRKAGWQNIVAYPADFTLEGDETYAPPLYLAKGLGRLRWVLHELLGLTFYYLTGKTDALLPAP